MNYYQNNNYQLPNDSNSVQQRSDDMRNILENLGGVFGNEPLTMKDVNNSISNEQKINDFLGIKENKNTSYIDQSSDWEVVVSLNETNHRVYTVKNSMREVYNGISFSLFESAYAVSLLLNKGKSVRKIDDIIELDEDFSDYRSQITSAKRNYNSSINLNESAKAEIYHQRYKQATEKAGAIQKVIKDLIDMI